MCANSQAIPYGTDRRTCGNRMNELDEEDGWPVERTGRLSPHHESMTSAEYVVGVCVFDASITINVARWFPFPPQSARCGGSCDAHSVGEVFKI